MKQIFLICLVMASASADAKTWSWMRRSTNIEDRREEARLPVWPVRVTPITGILPATNTKKDH
jgi:hypothetical protein